MERKISKKRSEKKIKEIKSHLKVKEISSKKKESELENEIDNTGSSPEIKISSNSRTSPSLEKVAEEESPRFVRQIRENNNREEEEVKYKEADSNYLPTTRNEKRSEVNYVEPKIDYSMVESEDRETKEMRRVMEETGERISQDRRHTWEPMEKPAFVEPDDKTKKYISKGEKIR